TARNQSAIVIHQQHGVDKRVADFRIDQMPKRVDGPLGTPEGVRVVVVEPGFAPFIKRYLANPWTGSGHIAVFAIHVADDPPPLQGVPQVGIKPLALFEGAAFHGYAAEPLVPFLPRLPDHAVKVPVGKLVLEVEARLLHADVGDGHFELHFLVLRGRKADIDTGMFAVYFIDSVYQLPVLPAGKLLEGLVYPGHEVDRYRLGAAYGCPHDGIALDFMVTALPCETLVGL